MAQQASTMPRDSLLGMDYGSLFDKIKGAKDTERQGIYLKAYLDKARMEGNWEETVQGYKNYLHRSSGKDRLVYADSMVLVAKRSGDAALIGSAHLTKGIVFYNSKTYRKALENYLIADQYLARTDDAYLRHKLKYNMALVKYYTEHFDEALDLLKECRDYFRDRSTPGYLNTLHLLGRCHGQMKNYGLSSEINLLGIAEGKRLGNMGLAMYFVQSEGINHALKGNYPLALVRLDSSLKAIRLKKNDFANEVLGEFYLGKSHWGLGNRERAVEYFKKVDTSFRERGYIKEELLDTYTHLTEHYGALGNQELQLVYLKRNIDAFEFMRSQSKYLEDKIKDGYDLKGIQREKQRIERLLWLKERRESLGFAVGIFLFALWVGVAYRHQKTRRVYRERFEAIMKSQGPPPKRPGRTPAAPSQRLDISLDNIDRVLGRLESFEKNHAFLDKKMSASKLAVIAEVNGKYLSQIIAHYKGKRVMEYINELRVEHIIERMKQDRKLIHYSNGSLAEVAGFNSERTFVNAFRARAGITPMFFIKRLKAKEVSG